MLGARDRPAALATIRAVLAADCACPEAAFRAEGVTVTEARELPGRRRFPWPVRPLIVMSMGVGVVVSCHRERLAWARAMLGSLPRDAVFAAPAIADLLGYVARDGQGWLGPDLKYACSADRFRPAVAPVGVAVTLVEGDAVAELYRQPGFRNALSYRRDSPRPDLAATVARVGGAIIGIAGAGAECDALWQIGVDVLPAHRGAGVGRALVGRLTEALLARGIVPYYSTAIANLASRSLALGLGYWPAWTEMGAKDQGARSGERE